MVRSRFAFTFYLAMSLSTFVSTAWADALVVVQVRDAQGKPADGEVKLVPVDGGPQYTCAAAAGTCRIDHVKGGRYTATVSGPEGASEPRTVVIPPSGTVSLIIAAKK